MKIRCREAVRMECIMDRNEFMKQLESLLQSISSSEREEALQYYNEYFNDAGQENEQDVIEALGSPVKVAENIKRDFYGSGYDEATYQKTSSERNAVVEYQTDTQEEKYSSESYDTYSIQKRKEQKGMSTGMIVLIVILCILASPLILSLLSGVLGILIGIIATWFSLIIGFGAVALSLFAVLVVLFVVGIMCMFTDPLVGVVLLGIGMLVGGFGILFLMLTVAMAGIATPAICRGIAALFRKIFRKKKYA